MPIKKVKQSSVRCRECDANSQDAFLEKIKGTNEYICDDCASESLGGSYRSSDDDDYDDDFSGSLEDDDYVEEVDDDY